MTQKIYGVNFATNTEILKQVINNPIIRMKNLSIMAVLCLLAFVSCKKTLDNPQDKPLAMLRDTTLSVCNYNAADLLANLHLTNARRKPTPTPTPTPTTPTPVPTGSGYSCILIDFDGQTVSNSYWNGGAPLQCASSGLSADEMNQVLNEVKVHYAAYKVVVTYDENVYNLANPAMRMRMIVTPTSSWYSSASGVAYTGSFTWGNETPAFVFSDRLYYGAHYIAEIVAHEAGHTLGLRHQSDYNADCSLLNSYKMGVVMGNSLYVSQGEWIYGTTLSCTTYQDDNLVMRNLLGLAF